MHRSQVFSACQVSRDCRDPRSRRRRPGRGYGVDEVSDMSRKGRLRNATAIDIDRRIRNAGDHLGGLIQHEKVVSEAAERNEIETELEERRKFERDLSAFFAAARTARNYLIQTAAAFGQEAWLAERLASEVFEFHGAVANQDLHDHPATVAKTYDVMGTAVADVVRLVDGARPPPRRPSRRPLPRSSAMPRYAVGRVDGESRAQAALTRARTPP